MNGATEGTFKPPLVLFQYINPRFAAHCGISYEFRHREIKTSITDKYFPPKWHDARIGEHRAKKVNNKDGTTQG